MSLIDQSISSQLRVANDRIAELEEQLAETIRLSAEKHRPAYDEQQQRIAELEQQLDKLKRMEFICSRCGIRKDGESEGGDF